LRNLERHVAAVCRKVARQVAEGRKGKVRVIASSLEGFLGPAPATREDALSTDQVGVATGLAWTEAGGDVLFIEATTMRGRGALILTGQLGDVMKESAQAALSYVKAHASELAIEPDAFEKFDLHIHVPAGAIPKDGPSAGITIASAIASLMSNRPIRHQTAMTGEITLRGKVLPVGGVKEKILAARRAGIETVLLPMKNEKDLVDVPEHLRKGLNLVFVKDVGEVLAAALRVVVLAPAEAIVEDKRKTPARDTSNRRRERLKPRAIAEPRRSPGR
jgi:ATP-dependent Lon protease